jgi:RimJ/RimL family protein N-acetyltransferase
MSQDGRISRPPTAACCPAGPEIPVRFPAGAAHDDGMGWQITDDVAGFLAMAGGFLRARAAENTILLTVAETLRVRGSQAAGPEPPRFGWQEGPTGTVGGAFLHTPPYPLVLSAMPDAVAAGLAGTLATAGVPVPGINAQAGTAQAFAAGWQSLTGTPARTHRRNRLHRLGTLRFPQPPADGTARVAGPADRDLLTAWLTEFAWEVRDAAGHTSQEVDDRLSYGGLTLWEDGGQPVSVAGLTRQVAGQVRVGPVYTPPGLRGRGYAGGATAAVSQAALAAGVPDVLLFTDLANPTSNGLYQRLGYQPSADFLVLQFPQPD